MSGEYVYSLYRRRHSPDVDWIAVERLGTGRGAARRRSVLTAEWRRAHGARPTPSLLGVSDVPTSPLFALAGMDADRERIEAAMRAAVVTRDAYLTEIASHLIVAGGKRLRPVLAVAAGRLNGPPVERRRRAGRRRLRAGAPRLAVPRRRDGRGRDPPRRRHRQRPVGQPAGDPRRRLPARAGIRDRRLARHRGGRAAGAHDRLAVRGPDRGAAPHLRHRLARRTATSPRSTARPRRCSAPRRASAASSPGSIDPRSTPSPSTATPTAWCSRSSTTCST